MIPCSSKLKQNALSKGGNIPCGKVTVFNKSGVAGLGGGLSREIIDGGPMGSKVWPAVGAEDYSQTMIFNWGNALPIGITESMLSDRMTFSVIWNGFVLLSRPQGYTGVVNYKFSYISTGFSFLTLDGDLVCQGSSANKLKEMEESDWIGLTYEKWVPIQAIFTRMGATNRRIQQEKFILFYMDDIDSVWKVVDSSFTSPRLMSYKNVVGNPIASIEATSDFALNKTYLLTIHKTGNNYHAHADSDPTEYAITPGSEQEYNINDDLVTITWNSNIAENNTGYIYTDGFDHGWDLPLVNNIEIENSAEAASVLTFNVPVTTGAWNPDNVNCTNAFTYLPETDNFGVLRRNRLIRCDLGYRVDGEEELITKFTGMIQDIFPDHKASGMTLQVTTIDCRTALIGSPIIKIEDLPIGGIPNDTAYDLITRFATTEDDAGPSGRIRPPAFDSWRIQDMVRAVGYLNNLNSSQLWAKDPVTGSYLINDLGNYLDRTETYPYAFRSEYATKSEIVSTSVLKEWDHGNLGNLLYKTWLKEPNELQQRAMYSGSSIDSPYLYTFPFDGDPYEQLQTIVKDYGLRLYVNTDGNLCLEAPNNPPLFNTHEDDDEDINFIEYSASWVKVPASHQTDARDQQAIRGFMHKTTSAGTATIHFRGVGLKVIFALPKTTSTCTVDIDNVRVDGVNVLDSLTGDIGHREFIDYVSEIGAMNLSCGNFYVGDNDYWYFSSGNVAALGYNPAIKTICNNLTYGDHIAEIKWDSGELAVNAFEVIEKAIDVPVHIFDTSQVVDVGYETSLDSQTNDVTVIGNQYTGNDYIQSRASDLFSMNSPDSANFLGVRRPWTIISPRLNNNAMADYLAQNLLLTYRMGKRFPRVNTVGLTWLSVYDCVAILDNDLGMYSDQNTIDWHIASYFTRYWITNTKESFSKDSDGAPSYTMSLEMTNFQPLPAYSRLPEAVTGIGKDYPNPLANINISIDDDLPTY